MTILYDNLGGMIPLPPLAVPMLPNKHFFTQNAATHV